MQYRLKHPELLLLTRPDGPPSAGGDQEWYRDLWQRRAGCGPTTAAALLAYLSQTCPALAPLAPEEGQTQAGFLRYMEQLWPYVTPGAMGLDKPESLVVGCRSFALSRGCQLAGEILPVPADRTARPALSACADFVAQALSADQPVAFLNYSNGALQNLDSWHWVPLVSLSQGETPPAGEEVLLCTVLDEGEKRLIDLALWLATTSRGGALVRLFPA